MMNKRAQDIIAKVAIRGFSFLFQFGLFLQYVRCGEKTDVFLIAVSISIFSITTLLFDFGSRTIAPIHRARGLNLEVKEILNLNWYSSILLLGLNLFSSLILILQFNCNTAVTGIAISMSIEKSLESVMALANDDRDTKFLLRIVIVRKVIPFFIFPLAVILGVEPTVAFVCIALLGTFFGCAIAFPWLYKNQLLHRMTRSGLLETFNKNARVSLSSLINNYTLLDIPLILVLVSSGASGSMAVVSKVASPFHLFNDLIIQNLKPVLANASNVQFLKIRKLLAIYFLIISLICLIIVLNSKWLISVTFGQEFLVANTTFKSLMGLLPFVLLSNQLSSILIILGRFRQLFFQSQIYAFSSICSAIVLGIIYGAEGVVIGIYGFHVLRVLLLFPQLKFFFISPQTIGKM